MNTQKALLISIVLFLIAVPATWPRDCTITTKGGFSGQCQKCYWEGNYLKFWLDGEWKQVKKENLIKIDWLDESSNSSPPSVPTDSKYPLLHELLVNIDCEYWSKESIVKWINTRGLNQRDKKALYQHLNASLTIMINYDKGNIYRIESGGTFQKPSDDIYFAFLDVVAISKILIDLEPDKKAYFYTIIGCVYGSVQEKELEKKYVLLGCQYGDQSACDLYLQL